MERVGELEAQLRRATEVERRQVEGSEAVARLATALRETEARLAAAEARGVQLLAGAQQAEEGRAMAERGVEGMRRQAAQAVQAAEAQGVRELQQQQREADNRVAELEEFAAGLQAECADQVRAWGGSQAWVW